MSEDTFLDHLLDQFLEAAEEHQDRRNRQLAYWCKLFPNTSFAPKQFYGMVVDDVRAQAVPSFEPGLVLFRQTGPFSPERLYMQLRRDRLIFEVCAAPFGTGLFVSSRLFDRRKEPSLLDFAVLFAVSAFFVFALLGLGWAVGLQWGWVWGVIVAAGVVAVVWTLLRLAAMEILGSVDRVLSDLPFIGLVYDWFFHPETYYREDLNNSYREAVHNAVMQAVDEMTKQKGLPPLTPEDRRPMIRDLTRR